jgi:multicomponent Na+:H+ antiporter subunit G
MAGSEALALGADALVFLGLVVCTIGVVGLFRMPDIYCELHSAAKAVFLGLAAFLLAAVATGDGAVIARVALIFVLLVLTTPVASHTIARAAWRRGEHLLPDGALDESGPSRPSRVQALPSQVRADEASEWPEPGER